MNRVFQRSSWLAAALFCAALLLSGCVAYPDGYYGYYGYPSSYYYYGYPAYTGSVSIGLGGWWGWGYGGRGHWHDWGPHRGYGWHH